MPWPCEVNHELELGSLHDRQVNGLLTFENPADVDADLAMRIGNARAVNSSGRRLRRTHEGK